MRNPPSQTRQLHTTIEQQHRRLRAQVALSLYYRYRRRPTPDELESHVRLALRSSHTSHAPPRSRQPHPLRLV